MSQDRGDTGPASNTLGPHESNLANIVDPRVQPQPDKMRDTTTTGAQPEEKEHHYGRDAAVAGGAGAVGISSYEASKDHGKDPAVGIHSYEPIKDHGKETAADPAMHEPNKLHKRNDPRGHPEQSPSAGGAMDSKHEKDLQKAREAEAAKGGDRGEKKEGFLHKLFHHHKDEDKGAGGKTASEGLVAHQYDQQPAQGLDQAQRQSHHIGTDGPIGVTIPAVVTHGQTRSAANIDKSWIDAEAEKIFEDHLGRDIYLVNDADAAGVAEVHYGAASASLTR